MNDDVLIGGFVLAILVLGGGLFVGMDTTYYNTEIVSKHFDYNDGRYYVEFMDTSFPNRTIGIPVSSNTFYTINIGDCKIIQQTTVWGANWEFNIYGDCP